jgi:hypothetical protein
MLQARTETASERERGEKIHIYICAQQFTLFIALQCFFSADQNDEFMHTVCVFLRERNEGRVQKNYAIKMKLTSTN